MVIIVKSKRKTKRDRLFEALEKNKRPDKKKGAQVVLHFLLTVVLQDGSENVKNFCRVLKEFPVARSGIIKNSVDPAAPVVLNGSIRDLCNLFYSGVCDTYTDFGFNKLDKKHS